MRITWKSRDDEFKSLNLFLELNPCDPAKNDKGADATARKLMEFIEQMNLDDFYEKFSFTSDFAIYNSIIEAMANLG